MRTGNISSLSERDWAAIRERRAFEQEERERQLLAEDQEQYQAYRNGLDLEQERVPRAYHVNHLSFEEWRSYTDPSIADPVVRGAAATNRALLLKVRQDEANQAEAERNAAREAVLAGQRDNEWKAPPANAPGQMSLDQERNFVREQARLFAENNSEFLPSKENFNNILEYLWTQGVSTPHQEALKAAWLRLRELGLIEERPAVEPEPEPAPVQEPPIETPADYVIEGFDPETQNPRLFTQREIWNMDSNTYRKAFKVWGQNRPKFTRGYYS